MSRTHSTDARDVPEGWSPFGRTPEEDGHAPVREDAAWRPRVIEGGRGHGQSTDSEEDADGFEAAVLDALAAAEDVQPAEEATVVPAEPAPVAAPEASAPVAPEPIQAPQAAPEVPVEAVPGPDSTLRTPHPETTPTQDTNPAQTAPEAPESAHSTPRFRTALGWLNVYDILDQPLPSVRAVYDQAWAAVGTHTGARRAVEVVVVCGIGVPISIACRVLDRAGHTAWRLASTAAAAGLWTTAAVTSSVDASVLAWWSVLAYWASTVIVIPAVLKATQK